MSVIYCVDIIQDDGVVVDVVLYMGIAFGLDIV